LRYLLDSCLLGGLCDDLISGRISSKRLIRDGAGLRMAISLRRRDCLRFTARGLGWWTNLSPLIIFSSCTSTEWVTYQLNVW
jgi:hypothetical protein